MGIKVYELATELKVPLAALTSTAKKLKIAGLQMSTSLNEQEETKLREALAKFHLGGALKKKSPLKKKLALKKSVSAKVDAPSAEISEPDVVPVTTSRLKKKAPVVIKSVVPEVAEQDVKSSPSLKKLIPRKDTPLKGKDSLDQAVKTALPATKDEKTTLSANNKVTYIPSSPSKLSGEKGTALPKKSLGKTTLKDADPDQKNDSTTSTSKKEATAKPADTPKPDQGFKFFKKMARPPAGDQGAKAGFTADNAPSFQETGFKKHARPAKRANRFRSQRSSFRTKTKSTSGKGPSTAQRKKAIVIPKILSVSELSNLTGLKAGVLIKSLLDLGIVANINQTIDAESAQLICPEIGIEIKIDDFNAESLLQETTPKKDLIKRPPVVTIMGHVDHGKTSLLDKIRSTDVASGEAGGITQHIGAYFVHTKEGGISFLDTPGHEAFTSMRARGANITDIVVLVVAANDGPKPQTIEAINHAKAAEVPILVAINKCDRSDADPESTKRKLMESGLIDESYGGDVTMVNVSAKTGAGIDELLNLLILQADTMELAASSKIRAKGIVIESRLDKIRGNTVSLLVQEGCLKTGDLLIANTVIGKVKAIFDYKGNKMDKVLPSHPAEILGMDKLPLSGDQFNVAENEKALKKIQHARLEKEHVAKLKNKPKIRMEDLFEQLQVVDKVVLNIILKTDVQGSLEAIQNTLSKWDSDSIEIRYLHSSVGAITSSDVALASASNAIVIGFNVRPDNSAKNLSKQENVQIKIYNVIYHIFDDVKSSLEGMIAPTIHQQELGKGLVLNVFTIPKVGVIAGCKIDTGKVINNCLVRVLRDNMVTHTGKISSLKRFKDDTKEVFEGFECGIMLDSFKEVRVNDSFEFYLETSQTATLSD
ncbi:MAG: translation initiation factor IF-2 [SAR324 cluster bacterium]|nr:translation initiation factor IF-2 [SAR324 cluster bacterium]